MVQFNPIQQGSYAGEYSRARQLQQQADAPAREFERYNDKIRMQQAQLAGKNIQAMAALSPTVEKLIGHEVEKHKKRAKIAASELAYETSLANPYAPADEDKIEYEKYKEEFEKDRDDYNDLAQAAYDKGASPEVVEELNNLSGWKAYYYGKIHLKTLSEGVEEALRTGMMGDSVKSSIDGGKTFFTPKEAVTFEQKAQSVQDLWNKFQEDHGLDTYEKHFLIDNYFPTAYNAKKKIINELRTIDRANKSAANLVTIKSNFTLDKNYEVAFKGIKAQWNPDTKTQYTNVEAHEILDKRIKELADVKMISVEDIDKISEEKTFSGKLFGKQWPAKIKEWKHYIKNAEKKLLDDKLDHNKIKGLEFQVKTEAWVQERYSNGEYITNAELNKIKIDYQRITGKKTASWIDDIYTRQEQSDDTARDYLDNKRKQNNGLTLEDLRPFSPTIFKEYIGFVKADAAFREIPEKQKALYTDQIVLWSKEANNLQGLNESGVQLEMKRNSLREFDLLVKDAIDNKAMSREQALQFAKEIIQKKYDLNGTSPNANGKAFLDKAFNIDNIRESLIDRNNAAEHLEEDPDLEQLPKGYERYIDSARRYRDGKLKKLPPYFDIATRHLKDITAEGFADRLLRRVDGEDKGLYGSQFKDTPRFKQKAAVDEVSKVLDISWHIKNPTKSTRAQVLVSMNDYEQVTKEPGSDSFFNSSALLTDWSAT